MWGAVELKQGVRPWEPPDLDEPPEILREFAIPLAGILRQYGETYFFCCIAGEAARANLWAYVPVTKEESHEARSWQATPATLEAFTSDDRPYVVAFHEEGPGVTQWATVEHPAKHDSPLEAAAQALDLKAAQLDLLHTAYA